MIRPPTPHSIRLRWETGHDIVVIGAEAGSVDPAIREETDRLLARRRAGIANLVSSMATRDSSLADEPRAVATIDALTLPEVYANLVGVHGWTADAFEAWLALALVGSIGEP
jgi:hypothetical protein